MRQKVACVTGAGARIGRSIAIALAEKGFDLIIHYNQNQQGILTTKQRIEALQRKAICVQADLSQHEQCLHFIDSVQQHCEHLDVLVNNASLFSPQKFETITHHMWQEMLQVNVTAPFVLSQGLLPLLKQGTLHTHLSLNTEEATKWRKACIVHLCDIGADRPLKGYTHYAVSKAALQMLVKSMAIELAPTISCVGISPGQIAWPPFFDQQARQKVIQRIPMQREGETKDIAQLLCHLVLEAPYINGAIIPVDGGLACRY